MKVAVLFQPNKSGIDQSLHKDKYFDIQFRKWDGEINGNTMVTKIPLEHIQPIMDEYRLLVNDHTLILSVSIGREPEGLEEVKELFNK